MKKVYALTIVLLSTLYSTGVKAQLNVGANSYIYVADNFLFVKNNINIEEGSDEINGHIYLRNEAQLLQGSGTSSNTGKGKLSVYQEGTVSNYSYNYWCSPIGGTDGSGNQNFGITMLGDRVTDLISNDALITGTYEGISSPLTIADNWIWAYINSDIYAPGEGGWQYAGANPFIHPGLGFTMKGTSGSNSNQLYDFRGRPNNSNISIPIESSKYTLTGNPYPSAIDLSQFLLDNADKIQTHAYFFEEDDSIASYTFMEYRGGYGTFTPGPVDSNGFATTLGVYLPAIYYARDRWGNSITDNGGVEGSKKHNRFAPIGQGFMIEGISGSSLEMLNKYRVFYKEVPGESEFSRATMTSSSTPGFLPEIPSVQGYDYTQVSTSPVPNIKINIKLENTGFRQIALLFNDSATDGIDRNMDTRANLDSATDGYFVLEDKEFVTNGHAFDINKKIAIGFKNNKSDTISYRIRIKEFENFSSVSTLYVHNKVLDTYHEILNNSFELFLPPQTTDNDTYELTFTDMPVSEKNNNIIPEKSKITIHQDNNIKSLHIENPSKETLTKYELYDLVGKLIYSDYLQSDIKYTQPTSTLANGLYIVKLTGKDGKVTSKKILIQH